MPKIKNTKHRVLISNLPKGFELVDGELVKKAHGGLVTGDQHNYGLVTFNPHAGDSENDREVDVRYSLSSVPRDVANIEAEGGETVLTDLTNDGNYGLYDITGPRHSSGGVPMFLPEQSFIFSDTEKMKLDKTELAEFGIESKKRITPAKVSKKFDLNRYYGLLNDEYADKTQANSAELMLIKNSESLSKLAFGQELKKDFEEGVPVAAHPYLNSIGIDPMEFTAQVQQRQQGGQEQMGEQPMSAMRYGGILPKAQNGKESCNEGSTWDEVTQSCILDNPAEIKSSASPFAGQNQYTSAAYSDYENNDIYDALPANPGQFGLTRPKTTAAETPIVETPTYGAPTVERTNKKGVGARMEQGLDRFMDSPFMNKVGEVGGFGVGAANVGNQIALNTKGEQAQQNMMKIGMVDNSVGVVEEDPNAMGYWDTNTGGINQKTQGKGPSGFNGYYGEDGMEIPKAQDGVEQLWESGKTYKGGSPEWNQWYMSDNAKQYRSDRYEQYKNLQSAKNSNKSDAAILDEDAYHKLYIQGQKLVRALNINLTPDERNEEDWDDYKDSRRWHKEIKKINDNTIAKNTADLAAMSDEDRDAALAANPDYINKDVLEDLDKAGFQNFQQGYIGGMNLEAGKGDASASDMQSTGKMDNKRLVNGVWVPLSDADEIGGNTTNDQWEEMTIPTYDEETQECICNDENGNEISIKPNFDADGKFINCPPCPKEPLDDVEVPEEIAPNAKVPFIQDLLKTRAIANRKRDLFLPWEPAEQKVRYEDVLEDPTRIIAAANSDANAAMQAAGAFAGPQALGARTAAIQGQNARAIADQVGAVNQRNVATINRGNAVRGQFEDSYNQRSNASNKRLYDNTMKTLQLGMDEQNFDNEQYADQMANQITNATHAYNDNSLRDYYGYDPLSGGDVYQKGSKAFKPVPEEDRFASITKAGEMASRYYKETGQQPTKEMMNYWMGIQSKRKSNSNETYAQRERRNEQGKVKKGGAMKQWASPFYTGKMGI